MVIIGAEKRCPINNDAVSTWHGVASWPTILEFIDMGQLHDDDNKHNRLVQLDLCGTSGVAPFFLALTRGSGCSFVA